MISVTDGWGISCEIAIRWVSMDLTDDESIGYKTSLYIINEKYWNIVGCVINTVVSRLLF